MIAVITVLAVLSACLLIYLFLLHRELQSIKNQLHEYRKGVEKPIDVVFIDKRLTELAAEINKNHVFQSEQKLSLAKEELHLKESISNISHDLRTPLTSIIGYLQLLKKTELTDEQHEYLDISLSRCRYLQTLVSDFYDISSLESKNNVLTVNKLNVNHILTDLVLSFTEQLEAKNITPVIKGFNPAAYAMADETMLKRIITNLLSNAIRHGKQELRIEILENDFIEITFENIVEHAKTMDVSRLFEKFYTADVSRYASGSGLGLYIVRILVEKMGGKVYAKLEGNRLSISLFLVKA